MIICGFPGVGKSVMAQQSNWVDLESTPFEKDWSRYAKVAKHMSDSGYVVMVSTHSEMLDALEKLNEDYIIVIPPLTDDYIYKKRYEERDNTPEFINKVMESWTHWLNDIIDRPSPYKTVIILESDSGIKELSKKFIGAFHED